MSSSNTQNYGLNYLPGSRDEHEGAKWATIMHNLAHSGLNEAVIRSDLHNITMWARIAVLWAYVISFKVNSHCAFTSRALILGVLDLARGSDVITESVLLSVELRRITVRHKSEPSQCARRMKPLLPPVLVSAAGCERPGSRPRCSQSSRVSRTNSNSFRKWNNVTWMWSFNGLKGDLCSHEKIFKQ